MLRGVAREAMKRSVDALPRSEALELASSPETTISPNEPLAAALEKMAVHGLGRLPVAEQGVLVGVLWREQAERYLSLIDRLGFPLADVVDEISPDDAMLGENVSVYLRTGVSALESIRRALDTAGRSSPSTILDFGCGHGRVLRILKAAFPKAGLTACDIDSSAVEFCARVLGAAPVVSSRRVSEVQIDGPFDLIWSGSVLTHIGEADWRDALSALASLLGESGLLVCTTAGPWSVERLRTGAVDYGLEPSQVQSLLDQYDGTGFGYVDYHPREGYGISVARPEWVHRVAEAEGRLRVLSYEERGWDAHQDVFVAAPA